MSQKVDPADPIEGSMLYRSVLNREEVKKPCKRVYPTKKPAGAVPKCPPLVYETNKSICTISKKPTLVDSLEECMLFKDETIDPIDRVYVKKNSIDILEKSLLLEEKLNKPLQRVRPIKKSAHCLEEYPLVVNKTCRFYQRKKTTIKKDHYDLSDVKEKPAVVTEDKFHLIKRKTDELPYDKNSIIMKEPVKFLEGICMLNTDKTGGIPQEVSNIKEEPLDILEGECQLATYKLDDHPKGVSVTKEKPVDFIGDECHLIIDKATEVPPEEKMKISIKEEPVDFFEEKCRKVKDTTDKIPPESSIIQIEQYDLQSGYSVKQESLVPFEECLLSIDSTEQYLQGESHIKEEANDPFEECLLSIDNTEQYPQGESHIKEEPNDSFEECLLFMDTNNDRASFSDKESANPLNGQCLIKQRIFVKSQEQLMALNRIDRKEESGESLTKSLVQKRANNVPSFQGTFSPVKAIEDGYQKASEAKKPDHKGIFFGLFHDLPELIGPIVSGLIPSKPRKRYPISGVKVWNHKCKFTKLCEKCNSCFSTVHALLAHLYSSHNMTIIPRYRCGRCNETFPDMHSLINHMTKKSEEILVFCCFCNDSFVIWKYLGKIRFKSSFYVKSQTCAFCKKRFSCAEFLTKHVCFSSRNCNQLLNSFTSGLRTTYH